MLTQTRKLCLLNAADRAWTERAKEYIEQGCNFLLLIPKNADEVNKFCRLFGLPENCAPKVMTQADFLLLIRYIDADAFDTVIETCDESHQVVFVDQIDFPINRPPRLKQFLVYSPVLGILSQHEHITPARDALNDWQDTSFGGPPNPEAGIYYFAKGRWKLFEEGRPI